MRVIDIIEETMADGPGLRTSVYVAGCSHHCPGCHNPESWDFLGGDYWDAIKLAQHIIQNPYTDVTFSGGDPIYQIKELIECCKYIKENSNKDIWVYTGFTLEELEEMPYYTELKQYINTIVTDPYIEELRDTTLQFRGSSNQRINKIQ